MPDDVSRIGNSKGNKPRLLKIRFKNADMARLCLRKKSVLLGNKNFSKIYISDDKTKQQQSYLKQLRDELADSASLMAKFNDFSMEIANSKPNIIALTETWLNSDVSNNMIGLNNYKLFRKDRIHGRGGGVCIYVNENLIKK
jgi:hypothetical protein